MNAEVSVQVLKTHWDGGELVYEHDLYINHCKIVLPQDGYIWCKNDCNLKIYSPSDEENELAFLGNWNLGLPAGTYYLKGDFTYYEISKFTIYYVATNDWGKEKNDDVDHATEIARGQVMHGTMVPWEEDLYRFTLPEAGRVSFSLTFRNVYDQDQGRYWGVELGDGPVVDGGFGVGTLHLLDGDGMWTTNDSDQTKTIRVENVGLAPGTYYLTLGTYYVDDPEEGDYQIFWDYEADQYCETERNDTPETADLLPLNQPFFAEWTHAQPLHARRDDLITSNLRSISRAWFLFPCRGFRERKKMKTTWECGLISMTEMGWI